MDWLLKNWTEGIQDMHMSFLQKSRNYTLVSSFVPYDGVLLGKTPSSNAI